jgi:hypothetical protein
MIDDKQYAHHVVQDDRSSKSKPNKAVFIKPSSPNPEPPWNETMQVRSAGIRSGATLVASGRTCVSNKSDSPSSSSCTILYWDSEHFLSRYI